MKIEVTTRKRAESIEQLPAAFSTYQKDQFDILPANRFETSIYRIPGLVANADNPIEPNLFMRGAGSDIESASANSSVGIFLDGIYLPRATGYQLSLHDIQQIEVLKGPQGVLYGKNVSGGIINFVSNKAEQANYGTADLVLGEDDKIQFNAVLNQAVNDDVAVRLAVNHDQQSGYAFNEFTQSEMDDDAHWSVQSKLNWQLTTDSTLDLTWLVQSDQSNGPWVDIAIPSEQNQALKNNSIRRGKNNLDGEIDTELQAVVAKYQHVFNEMTLSSNTAWVNGDFSYSNNDAGSFIDFGALPMTPSGLVDFSDPSYDPSYLNDDFYINNKSEEVSSWSQEVLLAIDGQFDWLLGGYFLSEKVTRLENPEYFFSNFYSQGSEISDSRSDNQTLGLFVDIAYPLRDDLILHTALRYTRDEKDFSLSRAVNNDPLGQPLVDDMGQQTTRFDITDDETWAAWTPSASLSWQYNEQLNVYLSYSRGFRSGGWNGEGTTSPQQATLTYDEEFADSYELGFRHESADSKAFTQLNFFWTEYDDLQTQQLVQVSGSDTPDNLIANASSASVAGVEFETAIEFDSASTLILRYAYMDSEINSNLWQTDSQYDPSCDCSINYVTNLSGNQLRRTPEHSASVDLNIRLMDSTQGSLNWLSHYAYTGKYYLDNDNNHRTQVDAFELLDMRLRYQPQQGDWYVQLWLKNALDEDIAIGVTDVLDSVLVTYAAPRTMGIGLGYTW
nr:TonB-dependent receptor [Marinifaba aquimaris]